MGEIDNSSLLRIFLIPLINSVFIIFTSNSKFKTKFNLFFASLVWQFLTISFFIYITELFFINYLQLILEKLFVYNNNRQIIVQILLFCFEFIIFFIAKQVIERHARILRTKNPNSYLHKGSALFEETYSEKMLKLSGIAIVYFAIMFVIFVIIIAALILLGSLGLIPKR